MKRLTCMTHVHVSKRTLAAAAAAVIIGIGATGCADAEDKSAATEAPADVPSGADSDSGSVGGGQAVLDDATSSPQTPQAPLSTRKLVITMTVGLEVEDVSTAVDRVIRLAATHRGQLYDSNLDLGDPRYAYGDLVFKLPPEEVDAFLSGLDPAIGRRTSLQGNTSDVTDQLTDLDAQIKTARASVERVRELMDRAETLSDIVVLESELTARQTRLEQLLAQQSNLESLVAMATITIHLTAAPDEQAAEDDGDSIGDAFREGWNAFVDTLQALVVFVGYTLPFLVLGAIAGLIAWRVKRSRAAGTRPE